MFANSEKLVFTPIADIANSIIRLDKLLIEEMILKRNLARKDKDFDKADEIRDELRSLGIILDDKADGTKWKKV